MNFFKIFLTMFIISIICIVMPFKYVAAGAIALITLLITSKFKILRENRAIVIISYIILFSYLGLILCGYYQTQNSSIYAGNKAEQTQAAKKISLSGDSIDTPFSERAISFIGIFVLLAITWFLSSNKKNISWRPVIWGVLLQIILGILVLKWGPAKTAFGYVDDLVKQLLAFTVEGARFVFGNLVENNLPVGMGMAGNGPITPDVGKFANAGAMFAFSVLPTIIFFSSLMTVLYHSGVMEYVIKFFAWIMQKTMGTSGSESLSAAANIFVGQTEAPLVVKPFIKTMTVSELHAIMVGGFATVAGGVMAAYVGFLKDFIPGIAGHLVTASIMSAPAALAISKLMFPETEESVTAGKLKTTIEKPDANVIEAASRGATDGMGLAINVAAMLIAFVGLLALINWILNSVGTIPSFKKGNFITFEILLIVFLILYFIFGKNRQKLERIPVLWCGVILFLGAIIARYHYGAVPINLSLENILGWVFAPISWTMGVPWAECKIVGRLLGEKLVLTEFIAYLHLAGIMAKGLLTQRSAVIASYALCGFANFASIGIQLGGIGGIAPKRRADLAKIGLKAMLGGAIAACMTGTIAGIFC